MLLYIRNILHRWNIHRIITTWIVGGIFDIWARKVQLDCCYYSWLAQSMSISVTVFISETTIFQKLSPSFYDQIKIKCLRQPSQCLIIGGYQSVRCGPHSAVQNKSSSTDYECQIGFNFVRGLSHGNNSLYCGKPLITNDIKLFDITLAGSNNCKEYSIILCWCISDRRVSRRKSIRWLTLAALVLPITMSHNSFR